MKSQYELARDRAAAAFEPYETGNHKEDSEFAFADGADWGRDFEKKRSEKLIAILKYAIERADNDTYEANGSEEYIEKALKALKEYEDAK